MNTDQDIRGNQSVPERENNRVALVTGASSGIGVYFAGELVKRGYNVLLVSNQEKEVLQVAEKISLQLENGQWARGIYKDLANSQAAEELFESYPNIEVLVNNAGMFFYQDVIDCSMQRVETIINLHVCTVTKLCRLYGERMRSSGRGVILNMSSISAHTPYPGLSLYTATKSYIRTFTKAFHDEMKEYGVKVMVVSPGAVATDLYNLPKDLQKVGVKIGIIYPPDKVARRGLERAFRGKKEFVPGWINQFFKPVYSILNSPCKRWIRKKTRHLMR